MIGKSELLIRICQEMKTQIDLFNWKEMLKFSISNYEKPQKEVRDLSHDLILIIFQVIGEDETMRYLEESSLRPHHKNTLEKEF